MELAELVLLVGVSGAIFLLHLRLLSVRVLGLRLLLRGLPDDEPPHILASHDPGMLDRQTDSMAGIVCYWEVCCSGVMPVPVAVVVVVVLCLR